MSRSIHGTVRGGRIEPDGTIDWPDGTRVEITEGTPALDKVGLAPSEWRDGPEAVGEWAEWLQTIEPLELTAEEVADFAAFDEAVARYTREAVRRQIEAESP